jgi:hypothetical protein
MVQNKLWSVWRIQSTIINKECIQEYLSHHILSLNQWISQLPPSGLYVSAYRNIFLGINQECSKIYFYNYQRTQQCMKIKLR